MLRFVILLIMAGLSFAIEVTVLDNGLIETYFTSLKLEGLPFQKRVKNASVPALVEFRIQNFIDSDVVNFQWSYNNKNIAITRFKANVSAKEDIYSTEKLTQLPQNVSALDVTLHLKDKNLNSGTYTLSVGGTSATGAVEVAPILPTFPKPKRILEGDVLRMLCAVEAYPKADAVIWSFAPLEANQIDDREALLVAYQQLKSMSKNASHYVFETSLDGTENDTIRFVKLVKSDNGLYACNTSNSHGYDITLILVSVKDRYAALWPFIGIVIEVTVLVTCILLYERHQMRSKPVESASKPDTTAGATASPTARGTTVEPINVGSTVTADNAVVATEDNNATAVDEKAEEVRQRGGVKC